MGGSINLPVNGSLPQNLINAELWPLKAQGPVTRLQPLGVPNIEKYFHPSMEQGRFFERNIASAQHWLQQKNKDLLEKISIHIRVNQLAVDGQLDNPARAIKFVATSINILKDISNFQTDIRGLISALTSNLNMLVQIESQMLQMLTQDLNALAALLRMICNWNLPKLPSIPNLLPDTIWHWNGFNFAPLSSFAAILANILSALKNFENFAFNQCHLNPPSTFPTAPSSITTYSGLPLGTTLIAPPLNGTIADPTDPTLPATTTPPAYLSPASPSINSANPFDTGSSMWGAVPDPSTIISNYQMPSETYQNNIVSIVPSLRPLTVEPTDADYANPNLAVRNPELKKALIEYINLGAIVASNYDPNIMAAWLFYLNLNRIGRAGAWIENFQAEYVTLISPSLLYLSQNPVPWNCVTPSTQVFDSPTAIPLIATLTGADPVTQGNMLWMLSYTEAALLGYTRNTTWDAYASPNYVSDFTGTDLDFKATTLDSAVTTTVILGEGTATYPTPCTYPSAMGAVLQKVIATATIAIQNTPTWTTTRPQFKYIYNQFAIATEVDRFSQFWREFNAHLQALFLQDPYLIQFVVTYPEALDSAIDPLGTSTIYNQLQYDAATRNRSWTPGVDLLTIPVSPVVNYSTTAQPTNGQNGWQGTNFDPVSYLSRPDIQQLPIPTQVAMLRTNISYAIVQQTAQAISNTIKESIQQTQTLIQTFQNIGFKAESLNAPNSVPVGNPLQVSFDVTDFDFTGNVTSPNTFTFQAAGTYALAVQLNWAAGDEGVRTASILLNGTIVLATTSTTPTQTAPTILQMSISQYFNMGDVVTVTAADSLSTAQTLAAGSYIYAIQTDTALPEDQPGIPSSGPPTTTQFTAGSTIAALVAVIVDSDGNIDPVDPTTVQTDTPGNPIYPIISGVSLSEGIAGDSITVGTSYGGIYTYTDAGFVTGGLIYAGVGGVLTQDYSSIVSTCQWTIVVGRAISYSEFIYEPHIPNLQNLGTF